MLPDAYVVEAIADAMRRSLGLSVGVVLYLPDGGLPEWRIDASDAQGQSWRAAAPTYAGAVFALAELVGFDVEG